MIKMFMIIIKIAKSKTIFECTELVRNDAREMCLLGPYKWKKVTDYSRRGRTIWGKTSVGMIVCTLTIKMTTYHCTA